MPLGHESLRFGNRPHYSFNRHTCGRAARIITAPIGFLVRVCAQVTSAGMLLYKAGLVEAARLRHTERKARARARAHTHTNTRADTKTHARTETHARTH